VGFEGTGGDPAQAARARAQIDHWIRRPKHD
jgi:hypothetical protein